MKKQLEIFNEELKTLKLNKRNKGVMLTGSVAYGTATEDADLDIVVLSDKDKFVFKYVDDVLVEIHFQTYNTMLKKLKSNTTEVYKYLYSKIIFDDGRLTYLIREANNIYNNYPNK